MIAHRLARRAVVLGLTTAASGCSSPNPVLYTVAPVPGTPQGGAPGVVLLREVGLPHYLDRQNIVRSSENYRLTVEANNWWGENLAGMLTRVLVQELNQRLPGSTVYGENSAVTPSPDVTVELNVQRLDEDSTGKLVLLAQAAVLPEH